MTEHGAVGNARLPLMRENTNAVFALMYRIRQQILTVKDPFHRLFYYWGLNQDFVRLAF